MCDVVQIDPEIMGGTPVFKGTRVPISTLFEYLADVVPNQDPIAEFLEQFPSVSPDQIARLLEHFRAIAASAHRAA